MVTKILLRYIFLYLHDSDGSDGSIREYILRAHGTGVTGTLSEADLQSVHQACKDLNQL